MRKASILFFAMAVAGVAFAQTPEVSIKRGKATIDEAYYYQLKQKADAYEAMAKQANSAQNQVDQLKAELAKQTKVELSTFVDSASYAIGKDMANAWQQQQLGINLRAAGQSLMDVANGKNTWDQSVMQPLLQRFQREFEQRQQQQQENMMASKDKNKAEGAAFLKENAKSKSIYTTKSGLQYKILEKGNGKKPTANSTVKVHYTGTLIDGTKFDSSVDRGQPIEFNINAVIPGWTEGLQLMNEGAHYILFIPPELGYGDQLVGAIPPGSTLIFDVQLLEVK